MEIGHPGVTTQKWTSGRVRNILVIVISFSHTSYVVKAKHLRDLLLAPATPSALAKLIFISL